MIKFVSCYILRVLILKNLIIEQFEKEIQVFLRDFQDVTKKKLSKVIKKSLSEEFLPELIKKIYDEYKSTDFRVLKLVFDLIMRDSERDFKNTFKMFEDENLKIEKDYKDDKIEKSQLKDYFEELINEVIMQIENIIYSSYLKTLKYYKDTIIRHFEKILNYSKVSNSERIQRKQKTLEGFINHLKNEDSFKDSVKDEIKSSIYLFFKDGLYWVKTKEHSEINKYKCILTGHCGTSGVGTPYLFHLFDSDLNILITVDYDIEKSTIFQIRGKNNLLPPKKSWKYLVGLINKDNIRYLKDNLEYIENFEVKKMFYELFKFLESSTNIQNLEKYYEDFFEQLSESMKFQNLEVLRGANNEVILEFKLNLGLLHIESSKELESFKRLFKTYYSLDISKVQTNFEPGKILKIRISIKFKDSEELDNIFQRLTIVDSDLYNENYVISLLKGNGYLKT